MSDRKERLVILKQPDGRWLACIRAVYPLSDKPIETILYWPIKNGFTTPLTFKEMNLKPWYVEHRGRDYGNGGHYVYYCGKERSFGGFLREVVLENGGQTQSIRTVNRPIPKPNVRKNIEVRFRSGRWEKYLKTKGWVSA